MTQLQFYQNKLAYEIDSADLYTAMQTETQLVVVDTRKETAYNKEHIQGAISIPHADITERSTQFLEKETLYVTYCDGIGCNASTRGALKLASLGFKVRELQGGIDWWKRDGFATSAGRSGSGKLGNCGC